MFKIENFIAGFGSKEVLHKITMTVKSQQCTAMIGPSGCGKSTLLRGLNRMHETNPNAYCSGVVTWKDRSIFDPTWKVSHLRRTIGMVFQKPTPFPTMSVKENVLVGRRMLRLNDETQSEDQIVQELLEKVGLWKEVRDKLAASGASLSGGQQQRLCIARTLAVKPEVILMDEPCSALDPIATGKIEELIVQLKVDHTIIIVTHNMQQARRIGDETAFLLLGDLVEMGPTEKIFTDAAKQETRDYIQGRFG